MQAKTSDGLWQDNANGPSAAVWHPTDHRAVHNWCR